MDEEILYNGVLLRQSDFKNNLEDRVALAIAAASSLRPRDKEAAIELLRLEAQQIIAMAYVNFSHRYKPINPEDIR